MRKTAIIALLLLFAGAGAGAAEDLAKQAPKAALSISEAGLTAIEASGYIEQAGLMREMEAAKMGEADGMAYPRVAFNGSVATGNNPVFVFGSLLERAEFTADRFQIDKLNSPSRETNIRTDINVGLPIYDAGRRSVMSAMAGHGMDAASQRREYAVQDVTLNVVKAYFGALLAGEREKATLESIKSAEADLKKARDLMDTGMAVKADVMALETQLAEFRQQAIEAATESHIAREGLNTLLGYPENSRPDLTTKLQSRSFDFPDAATVGQTAREKRPEAALVGIEVEKAGEGVKAAGNQYYPTIDAFGNYGGSSGDLTPGSTDWTFGVRMSLPILDFTRSSRTDQALSAQAAAKAYKRAELDRISFEAVSAYKRALAAGERLKVAAGAVEQAREAYRIGQDRYQVGLTGVTELLRAESALLRAQVGEAHARYGLYAGYAEFMRASGTLTDLKIFE